MWPSYGLKLVNPELKYLICSFLAYFAGLLFAKMMSSTALRETGASVLNHASCRGGDCFQKSARRRVGVNEVG